MNNSNAEECRLLAYKLASLLAQKPTQAVLSEAADIAGTLAENCGILDRGLLEELRSAIQEARLEPDETLVEHTKLFVNAYPRLECPPYETLYTEHSHQVMGKSGIAVAHIMDEAGLTVSKSFREPPEHVAAELELMAYLIYLSLAGDERGTLLQEKLYTEHLSRWLPRYASCLEKAARQRLYKAYARLLSSLVEAERDRWRQ